MASQAGSRIASIIGANIKAHRRGRGWTQSDLAKTLGVESFTVSRWERGAHRPSDESLVALGDAFGVPAVDFLREPLRKAA